MNQLEHNGTVYSHSDRTVPAQDWAVFNATHRIGEIAIFDSSDSPGYSWESTFVNEFSTAPTFADALRDLIECHERSYPTNASQPTEQKENSEVKK